MFECKNKNKKSVSVNKSDDTMKYYILNQTSRSGQSSKVRYHMMHSSSTNKRAFVCSGLCVHSTKRLGVGLIERRRQRGQHDS